MKRFGILALAGALAVVGCSKKTENAAKGAESAASAAKIAGALGGSQAAAKAPQLAAQARASAIGRSHYKDQIPGWDDATKEMVFSGTSEGYSYTAKIKFKRADGTVIDLGHDVLVTVDTTTFAQTPVSSNTAASMDFTWNASKSDGSSQSMTMNMKDNGDTATINGSGTIKDTAQKLDLTLTFTNMTAGKGGLTSGTMTGSGTADGETFSMSVTWTNGVGDGTITTDKETAKIHINADGSGYWEDEKGEKHNFTA